MITGAPGLLIGTLNDCEALIAGEALSVAVTVKLADPALVGVPDNDPSLPSVRPGGGAPVVTFHVKGGEPPLATVNENPGYAYVTVPAGGVGVGAITIGESATSTLTGRIPVRAGIDESATMIVMAKVPATTGLPVNCPLGLSDIPGGRAPDSDQVNGGTPPLATVNV